MVRPPFVLIGGSLPILAGVLLRRGRSTRRGALAGVLLVPLILITVLVGLFILILPIVLLVLLPS